MKYSLIKLFLLAFFIACSGEPVGIPVGYSTQLNLRKENKLHMTERHFQFFTSVLQNEAETHFSGKMFFAYDTLYTSTLQRSIGSEPEAMFAADSDVTIYQSDPGDIHSLFYSRKGWFIYRTLIPETAHRQTVVIDVAGKDSATIAEYFFAGKTKEIIK
ncbi:MAG: hypothetical protein EOM06_02410 [Sphingobacteriia bacterium]|nr:hypothetical protein [Sphingobacteriia bacterium]